MKNKVLMTFLALYATVSLHANNHTVRGHLKENIGITEYINNFKVAIGKKSTKEIRKALIGEYKLVPVANATIVLYGNDFKLQTKTNKNGDFEFYNAPYGNHELLGIINKNGKELVVHKNRLGHGKFIRLRVNFTNSITVVGKVVNQLGQPQANAKGKALLENKHQTTGDFIDETWNVKTGSDGEFILRGVSPPNLRIITGALTRGNLSTLNSLIINVENSQGIKKNIIIKPVSQDTLKEAREFFALYEKASLIWNKEYKDEKKQMVVRKEKGKLTFPKSEGNKIYVEIILDEKGK
jgi:hypothetical protein